MFFLAEIIIMNNNNNNRWRSSHSIWFTIFSDFSIYVYVIIDFPVIFNEKQS